MFIPQLKEDISKLCERADNDFPYESLYKEYAKVFLYSNENIYQMLQMASHDLNSRKALGILSGGTFPLESILYGFREIDCIDLNRFSFYFFELMLSSFKGLDHPDFLKFWGYDDSRQSNSFLSESTYQRFSHFLAKDYQIAWDSFYDFTGGFGQNQGLVFTKKCENKLPSYLKKDVFLKLKRILLDEEVKLRYFAMNLEDLFSEPNLDVYGLIYFSNVVQFYDENRLQDYKYKVKLTYQTFQEKLEKGGIFFANYCLSASLHESFIESLLRIISSCEQTVPSNSNYWDELLEKYGDIFHMQSIPNSQDYVLMATKK